MAVIAYMLTWTTYGTWLQGDRRGWVKRSKIYTSDPMLEEANRRQMRNDGVVLNEEQRRLVAQSIMAEAVELRQKIFALVVCDNHVHLAMQNIGMPIGRVASHYKNAARLILQDYGFCGKLWTAGFDKRYCMNDQELAAKIAYIQGHENAKAEIKIYYS